MKSEIEIRFYNPSDRSSIERMAEQILADGTVFPFEKMDGVINYWFSPGAKCYVASEAGLVVGTFVIKPNLPDRCSHIANAGYMVDVRHRGKGIGRTMAEQSIQLARGLGYEAMQFNIVVETNVAAVRLWESLGFARVAKIPAAFRLPDAGKVGVWIMHRVL